MITSLLYKARAKGVQMTEFEITSKDEELKKKCGKAVYVPPQITLLDVKNTKTGAQNLSEASDIIGPVS